MTPEEFILKWLKEGGVEVSALNSSFQDAFHAEFGGKRKEYFWGAQPVLKAQRILRKMQLAGKLERKRIGLGGVWQPGFPKWIYSYYLPEPNSKKSV